MNNKQGTKNTATTKWISWIAGVIIAFMLIDVSFVAFARVKPTNGDATLTQQLIGSAKSELTPGDLGFLSGIRATGSTLNDLVHGRGFHWIKEVNRIKGASQQGGKYVEGDRYRKAFNNWNKNKHVKINLTGGLKNLNGSRTKIDSIGNDSRLTSGQNKSIKKYITDNYNKWYKQQLKKKGYVSRAAAEEEAMELTGDAYNKVLKGTKNAKIAKEVNKELGNSESDIAKGNHKQDKDQSASNSEPSTFSGKVAKALLDMFYSSGIGEWMAKSGAGATIFGINYSEGMSGPAMYSQIATAYNENGYNEIYPSTAYTRDIQSVGVVIGPVFLALSAVLIMIILIVQTTRMGVGQSFNPVQSRLEWYHSLVDTAIAVTGCLSYNLLISVILSVNGAIVTGLAGFMAGTNTSSGYSILSEAVTLGFSKTTINMLTSGTFLGSEFVGIIFSVIYLCTYIGLAVYIKYYYFVREVVFTILWALGPVFIAFWPSVWGKKRTINWLREIIGTVMIQSIHSLTITFMAVLMAWNNDNWASQVGDIHKKSNLQAASETLKHGWNVATDGNRGLLNKVLGTGGELIKGAGQAVGAVNPGTSVSNAYMHFETMVIGFIIMVMFQPLSKALADLFGLQTSMLDEIHQSTRTSLKNGGKKALAVGIGAAGAVALGTGALALGAASGGLSLVGGAQALKAAGGAAKAAKEGEKATAFAKAFKDAKRKSPTNEMRRKLAGPRAFVNGLAGRNIGELLGKTAANVAGASPMKTIAMTRLGGEIGTRAAHLASNRLSKLGLKEADPNRKMKDALKDNIKKTTDKAANNSVKSAIDKAAGFDDFISKAKAAPDFDTNTDLQNAVKAAEEAKASSKNMSLDEKQALEAKAKNLLKGKNNYKDAQAINKAFRDAVDKDDSLSAKEKERAKQIGDQAMILAGAPANDPKILMDKMGYGDAEEARKVAENAKLGDIEAKFNKGQLPNISPNEMSFDDFKQSSLFASQYQPQVKAAGKAAAQEALNNSTGHIYGNVDDNLFQKGLDASDGTIIDSDIFKREVAKGLKAENPSMSDAKANSFAAVADPIDGQSLTQSVDTLDGTGSIKILDASLWHRLNSQQANTVNSTLGGIKGITGEQLDDIYNSSGYNAYGGLIGNGAEDPTAEDFNNYLTNMDKAADYQQEQENWARIHNATERGASFDPTNLGTWFGNLGISSGNSKTASASYATNATKADGNDTSDQPQTRWDAMAQDRITNNPYLEPHSQGLTLDQAFDMMPKVFDGQNNPIGVQRGSYRLAIQNTQSIMQAQDENGNWFMVGNAGRGDGTLEAGDTVYQDLDLSADGVPSLAYDTAAHSLSRPYRYQNGRKVPTTLTNGVPRLTSYFDDASFADQAQAVPGDFMHLPVSQILRRSRDWNTSPTVEQYEGYKDFRLQGDNGTMVITGINPVTNNREVLSQGTKRNDFFKNLPDQVNFSIPLMKNGETGLDVNRSDTPQIFTNGNVDQNEKERANDIIANFFAGSDDENSNINRLNDFLHDSMMPETESYLRNFIASNPGYQSGTNLDAFYRSLYDDDE